MQIASILEVVNAEFEITLFLFVAAWIANSEKLWCKVTSNSGKVLIND